MFAVLPDGEKSPNGFDIIPPMNRIKWIALYTGLAVLLLLPRLPGLDSFVTLDEPSWLSQGANFYYALGQREFQNTVYEYQPAVTTMWIVTAAMLAYFPQYRGLGQGYLNYEKGILDPFMLEHGKDPLILLRDARLIQVLLIAALMLFAFYLLQRLIGTVPALFAILLTSFDPFFLSQARLLDHEAMLALFTSISVLALLNYLLLGRSLIFVIFSAVSAGLAQLTKSSGIALLAPVGLIFLIHLFQDHRAGNGFYKALSGLLKVLAVWLAFLAATYVFFWPGMWVAPGEMLYQVYGNALSYAFRGARLIALNEVQAPPLRLDTDPNGFLQMLNTIFWRTTPLTWLGVLFGLALSLWRDRELLSPTARTVGLHLLVLAAAFILMFGLAQGRNSPHYTLSSYVALNLFAGMGWVFALKWLGNSVTLLRATRMQILVLSIVFVTQAASAVAHFPYYFTYENPVLSSLMPQNQPQFPYGEGLQLAGQYLSKLPDAQNRGALVYYGRGCFSYYFPGQTTSFRPYYADPGHEQDLLKALAASDYLVVYYATQGHLTKYSKMLGALEAVQPEKEFWLNGYKYAVIYRIDSFPPGVYDALVK
jgi:4-amino-4-deoxy-L-arabinose transferase-like glycosyltransferase